MLRDRVKCAVANPGGPIGVGSVVMLGAAPVGFRSFLAAFGAGQPAYFVLSDGAGKALGGIWTVNGDGTATITAILINDATGGTGSETFASACTAWCAIPSAHALTSTTVPTANLPMGTFRHTNVGNATALNEYAALGQVQNGAAIWGGTAGGTANALTISLTPAITAYAAGQSFRFIANATNTGAVTLSVNGLSAASVAKGNGLTALEAGDIPAGHPITVQYDGVRFRLTGVQSALGTTLSAAANAAAARATLGATATGGAVITAADAAAGRAALVAPPTPTATPGALGQWGQAGASLGDPLVLPAGGTWAYLFFNYNNLNDFTGTVIAGAAAGGTTLNPGVANFYWTGLAWRVA